MRLSCFDGAGLYLGVKIGRHDYLGDLEIDEVAEMLSIEELMANQLRTDSETEDSFAEAFVEDILDGTLETEGFRLVSFPA